MAHHLHEGLRYMLLRNRADGRNAWLDGHEFFHNGYSNDGLTWYWRCCKRLKPGIMCLATLNTDVGGGNPRYGLNHHNDHCPAEPNRLLARIAIDKAKEAGATSGTGTGRIVKSIGSRLHPDVAVWFPKFDSMRRVVSRSRRKAQGGVNLADNTLDGIVLTQQMCRHPYDPDGTILIEDTGPDDPERMLIFGTAESLELLEAHHEWSGDGTFATAPSVFEQLYTIHVTIDGKTVPTLFVLMANKERALYVRMLDVLVNAFPELLNNPPTRLMTDFETAAFTAFIQTFPNITCTGCFFHLMQCVWRRCQSLGLTAAYETDHEASMFIRMLPALAFVPVANVVQAYNDIMNDPAVQMIQGRFPPLVLLTIYFERNFVLGRGRGAIGGGPRFPIALWNCYDRILAGFPRTNNGVEGWHRSFNDAVGPHHPHLWHLLNVVREELGYQTNQQFLFNHVPHVNPTPPKPRHRVRNQRVLQIAQQYDPDNHYEYCRRMAYTFSLN